MSLTRKSMSQRDPDTLDVRVQPMRRRHVRHVLKIEQQVYPRPWTLGVFHSELGIKDGSRCYVVAKVGSALVGYAGLMRSVDEAHVTNIAVDPAWHRHKIGSRLLLALAYAGRHSGARHLTLEVRVSNVAAQAMYARFGFSPVGVRARYYENTEDAIVMWAHDIDAPEYAERLRRLEADLPGTTAWDGVA
jgi:[ribosomal protein S18]-alanine N-acetyltransferase